MNESRAAKSGTELYRSDDWGVISRLMVATESVLASAATAKVVVSAVFDEGALTEESGLCATRAASELAAATGEGGLCPIVESILISAVTVAGTSVGALSGGLSRVFLSFWSVMQKPYSYKQLHIVYR